MYKSTLLLIHLTIHNIEQIDRGYEDIENRLRKIGAKIKRVKTQ